jgi:hypothetical protein
MEYFNHSRTQVHSLILQNKAEKPANLITIRNSMKLHKNYFDALSRRYTRTVTKFCKLQKFHLSDRIRQSHQINTIRSNYSEVRGPACSISTTYLGRSWVLILGRIPAIPTVFIVVFFSPLESDFGTVPEMWPLTVSFTSYPNQYTTLILHRTLRVYILSHRIFACIINT